MLFPVSSQQGLFYMRWAFGSTVAIFSIVNLRKAHPSPAGSSISRFDLALSVAIDLME